MSANVVSSFFTPEGEPKYNSKDSESSSDVGDHFLHIIDELNLSLNEFQMPKKVTCIYNPTLYARHTFEMYVRKYCNTTKHIMYLGMNPGPYGMSQTGVPFGEVSSVRDWLGIEGPVGKPPKELKKRIVTGFNCPRKEVSGQRFWGLFRDLCKTPKKFFESSFVYNYINQQWMKDDGVNITPSDFTVSQMEPLYKICDPVLIKVLELYEVEKIVAIGRFCETRAQKAIEKYGTRHHIEILYLPHPSPRVVNNNDWEEKAKDHLKKYDLMKYYITRNTLPT